MGAQEGTVTLWHGSRVVVAHPTFGQGSPYNDYGLGFYCTRHRELACEWACTSVSGGFANQYELDMDGLSVLNLDDGQHSILGWLALLVANRRFDPKSAVEAQGIAYLREHFLPEVAQADVVVGYRADDSYFSFARSFVRNTISVDQLACAMRLGELGEQVCVRSARAFGQLTFVGAEVAEQGVWYPRRKLRDDEARARYRQIALEDDLSGLYMRDVIREGVTGVDLRLR